MRFDPMTGEPIYETEEERRNAQGQAEGQTMTPQQPNPGGQELSPQQSAGGQTPPPQQQMPGGQTPPLSQQQQMPGGQTPPPQQQSAGGQTPPPPQQQQSAGGQTPPPQQQMPGGQTPPPQQQQMPGGWIPPQMQQDYGTAPKKKGGALKYVIIAVVACVIALGGTAVALVGSGVFANESVKILEACAKTYHPYEIVDDLDCRKIVETNDYTIRAKGDMDGEDFDVSVGQKDDSYAVKGSATIEGMDVDIKASLDPEQLRISVPFLDEKSVFVYDYTAEDNDGYLMESMDEDEIDAFNSALKLATSTKDQEELWKKLIADYREEYDKMETKKIGKKSFEVNDKKVSCKGYELTITEENIDKLISISDDAFKEYYGSSVYEMMEYGDMFDSMKEDLEGKGGIKAKFYVYKNQLAHVQLENEKKGTVDIAFLGGDYRMQNIEITSSEGDKITVSADMDGSEETIEVTSDDQKVFESKYDTKSGDYDIMLDNDSAAKVSGNISGSEKEKVITIDSLEMDEEDVPLDMTITLSKGMELEEIKGDEKDIGKMDENDWEDIFSEYYSKLYDLY